MAIAFLLLLLIILAGMTGLFDFIWELRNPAYRIVQERIPHPNHDADARVWVVQEKYMFGEWSTIATFLWDEFDNAEYYVNYLKRNK